MPAVLKEHSRFEMPMVQSIIQGKITVIQNLGEVSKAISRDADMVAKHLIMECGTSGVQNGQHLTLKGQFRQAQAQEKFEGFVKEFVLCGECGRPDTKIIKEGRIHFLKCEACGSKHALSAPKAIPKAESKEPEIGEEITLDITGIGKKGDGTARLGKYIVFVSNARIGQQVKARINGIQGTMIFAEAVTVSK
ncbi:MAG: TRAM domain-containing protein [Candidatus Hydrothermarchaeales archaeon]